MAYVLAWDEQIHKQQLAVILQNQSQGVTLTDDSIDST
jgi:hypothetical protein